MTEIYTSVTVSALALTVIFIVLIILIGVIKVMVYFVPYKEDPSLPKTGSPSTPHARRRTRRSDPRRPGCSFGKISQRNTNRQRPASLKNIQLFFLNDSRVSRFLNAGEKPGLTINASSNLVLARSNSPAIK